MVKLEFDVWMIKLTYNDVHSRPQSRIAVTKNSTSHSSANGHVSHRMHAGYDDYHIIYTVRIYTMSQKNVPTFALK